MTRTYFTQKSGSRPSTSDCCLSSSFYLNSIFGNIRTETSRLPDLFKVKIDRVSSFVKQFNDRREVRAFMSENSTKHRENCDHCLSVSHSHFFHQAVCQNSPFLSLLNECTCIKQVSNT